MVRKKIHVVLRHDMFLLLGLFLFTLKSYPIYFRAIGLALIILFCLTEKITLKSRALTEGCLFFILLIISVLRFQIFLFSESPSIYGKAFNGNFSKYFILIILWILLRSILYNREGREKLIKSLILILKFHVLFFLIQIAIFFTSGFYIDVPDFLTGTPSRHGGFYGLQGIGEIRPTGLLIEPSDYFTVVLVLSAIIFSKRKTFSEHKILFSVSILTMYLSLSTAALVIATLFLIYVFYYNKIFRKWYVIMGLFLCVSFGTGIIISSDIFQRSLDKSEGRSGDIRIGLIKEVSQRTDHILFGYGLFSLDPQVYKQSTTETGNSEVASIADSGVLIYLWIILGYFGIFLYFFICWKLFNIDISYLWLFIIVSLSKVGMFSPLLILFLVFYLSKYKLNLQPLNLSQIK